MLNIFISVFYNFEIEKLLEWFKFISDPINCFLSFSKTCLAWANSSRAASNKLRCASSVSASSNSDAITSELNGRVSFCV